jgi:hypothetical protein
MPPKRKPKVASTDASKGRKRPAAVAVATPESDAEFSSSDGFSDPDEDVTEGDLVTLDGQNVFDHACVRDASRTRVSDRTRTQYDLFIGLMAAFALSKDQFKNLVVSNDGLPTFKPPLPINFVSAYIDFVEQKRVPWLGVDGATKCVSPSYHKAVVLSLKDLYVCEQVIMSDEMELFLFSKRRKYTRDIQNMRAVGTYPEQQQRFITSEGYSDLAKKVAQATPSSSGGWAVQAFAGLWAYCLLLWNLMARCDRVARLRWADFGWYKDALTTYLCKSKCDQAGINAFHKKIYFNESMPEVCSVTALAVLFFSRDEESVRSEFVFPRSDTRRNGNRYLNKIISAHYNTEEDTALFGCDPLRISWHHFKRGAFTFLAGLTDGCSYVATKLRADQKVADVSRVYTFFGQGQDGVIGRLLAMLPYGDPEFVGCAPVLPASGISAVLSSVVPDWETLDAKFKLTVAPRFLACLVWRYDWLKKSLASDHPLWQSMLITSSKLLELRTYVSVEERPLSGLTGVSLEMRNALRLNALSASALTSRVETVPQRPAATLVVHREHVPPGERDDLGLRVLQPLPKDRKVINHLTIRQAWRAWFIVSDSLPFPLRFAEGKLHLASDITALSRIKTCISAISHGINHSEILQHPETTFDWGFASLQKSLFNFDSSLSVQSYNSPGTLERQLRDARKRGWKFQNEAVAFRTGPPPTRPLEVAVAEAQVIIAQAAHANIIHPPKPKSYWKCTHCRSQWSTRAKFREHHETQFGCKAPIQCRNATGKDCDKCVIRVIEKGDDAHYFLGDDAQVEGHISNQQRDTTEITGRVLSVYVRTCKPLNKQ